MASFEPRGSSIRAIVRLPGGGKKTATFDTRAEAEYWAARMEEKKAVGALRGGEGERITNAQLFEAFLDDIASKTDSAKQNRLRILNWMNDPLATKKLVATTTQDINEWIERRSSTPSERTGERLLGSTINRELNLMSAAFGYAVKTRKWITTNPCHGALRQEEAGPRKRTSLTAEEIKALELSTGYRADGPLATKISRVGACFLLALETGMRSGEILRIKPKDYLRNKRTVHVTAKESGGRKGSRSGRVRQGADRYVPLTQRAVELLDQLLASMPDGQEPKPKMQNPPYIVGLDDAQRDALWRKCRDRAGVKDLTYHDTKHEAATRMSKFLDVLDLSYAIGTKDIKILRDTYYQNDASRSAAMLPAKLSV